jgi:hypothetical protein
MNQLGVITHLYMEAMLGISLYSYLSELPKTLFLYYYCLYILFNKIVDKAKTDSTWKAGGVGGGGGVGE